MQQRVLHLQVTADLKLFVKLSRNRKRLFHRTNLVRASAATTEQVDTYNKLMQQQMNWDPKLNPYEYHPQLGKFRLRLRDLWVCRM